MLKNWLVDGQLTVDKWMTMIYDRQVVMILPADER